MRIKISVTRVIAGILALMILAPLETGAQTPPNQPQLAPNSTQLTVEQYDQMLAPIALYPDPLLAQILTAATYPLEIVQADRWLQNPNNAALKDDQLAAALEQQPWDPSVKSLIPFPQVLRMMDENLTWTENLGEAFLAGQPAVMDSVQRLRHRAQDAGTLQSTPQGAVSVQGSSIMIEPPSPDVVYVPVYDPSVVYGMWPYYDYPPYYFPGFFDVVMIGGIGYGWFGFGINVPLWGWGRWDWRRHRLDIDGRRFSFINARHPPIPSGAWQHDPFHRGGVPYRDAETRSRFRGESGTPDARRIFRGFPTAPALQPIPPLQPIQPLQPTPHPGRERQTVPQVIRPPQSAQTQAPQPSHAPSPPAFESFGRGVDIRVESARGHASRGTPPTMQGGGGEGRQHSAPAFGGGRRQ